MRKLLLLISILALWTCTASAAIDSVRVDSTESGVVYLGRVEGSIGPTVAGYMERVIDRANEAGAVAVIFELDTPGGLLDATKEIVQLFLQSRMPIIMYVSPEGASAGSAGVFITLASHIAAMAPATNIGAASPVQMGGGGGEMDTVMQKKLFNYAESYIESIAERRNRNVEWAKSAVRDAESITAQEALEKNVIDIIATDRTDLLNQVHGREINNLPLQTKRATIEEVPLNFSERFFRFLFQPQVMLILTMVAIYGIIGEVTNPGAIVPGVAGAIALILLLYTVSAMPVNVAGFVLIVLAIVLFIAEAFTPTFGLLIAGGGVAFFLGAMMLFQNLSPSFQLTWYWLLPATILTMGFFAVIVFYGIKAQYGEIKTGNEMLIGRTAEVVDAIDSRGGRVFVNGEYWNATSDAPIEEGENCEIEEVNGLTLRVIKK